MEKFLASKIPNYILRISAILKNNGFACYLVGGPVRDMLMNKIPDDFDLATNAKPEDTVRIFPRSVSTGAKFGTIIVLQEDSEGEYHNVEVTTFRSEADYIDGRWPAKVEFTNDLYKDLGRRDFTINSLAVDLQSLGDGIEDNDVIDLFGGISDIHTGKIRTVGTPSERLSEDGLRSFRACRLASQLNFQIEQETLSAIRSTLSISKEISIERVRDEFIKLLMRSSKPSYGINLLKETGLLELFLPELLECVDIKQPSKYHVYNVYNHILATVDAAEDSVKLAALFHDIGKPRCSDGKGHFYKHDLVSAQMTKEIMKRLKFPNKEIDRVSRLVRWHMFVYSGFEGNKENIGWTDSAIRRFIKNVGGSDNIDDLFKLRIADALGNPRSLFDPGEIRLLSARVAEVRAKDMALNFCDLAISGDDIIALGVDNGPEIGRILKYLLDLVIDNPDLNNRENLIKLVSQQL